MCVSNKHTKQRSFSLGDNNTPKAMQVPSFVEKNSSKHKSNHIISREDLSFKRHKVQHNYHDHSLDTDNDSQSKRKGRGGVTTPFPVRLHQMLDKVGVDGLASVVSWKPHGRCFVVHKQKEFVDIVIPKYFQQTKYASFQRQLNLYGFSRISQGKDKGGYYHELFLRGKRFLCERMQRMKVKGTLTRGASNPDKEPNFYSMPPVSVPSFEDSENSLSSDEFSSSSSSSNKSIDSESEDTFEGKKFHHIPENCHLSELPVPTEVTSKNQSILAFTGPPQTAERKVPNQNLPETIFSGFKPESIESDTKQTTKNIACGIDMIRSFPSTNSFASFKVERSDSFDLEVDRLSLAGCNDGELSFVAGEMWDEDDSLFMEF